MKLTVYVREIDERFMDLVAEASSRKVSGWAYRALLEAAVREARARGMKIPAAILEQLERVRVESESQGATKPRSKKET